MLILRQLSIFAKSSFRYYSKKPGKMSLGQNLVHQEIMRYVTPYSRINIKTDILVKIYPADVFTYPNGDAFIAELHGDTVKNCTATMSVEVSEDEKEVNVELKKLDPKSTFYCQLSLPIKAEIIVDSKDSVNIQNVQSENVKINAEKDINGNDIRGENIYMCTHEGRIRMKGLILGKRTVLKNCGNGRITLDKLQGDDLFCKTKSGKISVNSCYVLQSKFETNTGDLELNNIHRNCEVHVNEGSRVKISGIHGNLRLLTCGGSLDLQFSELEGESLITAKSVDSAKINISEEIEKTSEFNFKNPGGIILNESLAHCSEFLTNNSKTFKNFDNSKTSNIIIANIESKNPLELGKLSWEDSLRAKLSIFNNKN